MAQRSRARRAMGGSEAMLAVEVVRVEDRHCGSAEGMPLFANMPRCASERAQGSRLERGYFRTRRKARCPIRTGRH
eukprot:364930-Prymnesium_polylepis.1